VRTFAAPVSRTVAPKETALDGYRKTLATSEPPTEATAAAVPGVTTSRTVTERGSTESEIVSQVTAASALDAELSNDGGVDC